MSYKFEWKPDCGGDWVLQGANYFACYWPDNTFTACVFAPGSDPEIDDPSASMASSVAGPSRPECMAAAERWISEQLDEMRRSGVRAEPSLRRAEGTFTSPEVKARLWTTYRHALEQDFEHEHPEGEGEPECPACWVQTIANVLGVES